jgi:hypothetical protein
MLPPLALLPPEMEPITAECTAAIARARPSSSARFRINVESWLTPLVLVTGPGLALGTGVESSSLSKYRLEATGGGMATTLMA